MHIFNRKLVFALVASLGEVCVYVLLPQFVSRFKEMHRQINNSFMQSFQSVRPHVGKELNCNP